MISFFHVGWKSYQKSLKRRKKAGLPKGGLRRICFTLAVFLLGFFGYGLFSTKSSNVELVTLEASSATPVSAEICDLTKEVELGKKWDRCVFSRLLKPEILQNEPQEVIFKNESRSWNAELSIDPELQRFVQKKLRDYRVDWGGVAVMDASTGEVLALASHSEKGRTFRNLGLNAGFPAASIFKIVTAAAALDQNVVERTQSFKYRLRFRRDEDTIRRSDLLKPGGNNVATVEEAFAKSENKIFGKIGSQIGAARLLEYAQRFGFNVTIPLEIPVDMSRAGTSTDEEADEDEDIVEQARLAAGFKGATLSPLHGAMIAAAVVNDGKMMLPFLVRRVSDEEGKEVFSSKPSVWSNPMSEETARELRLMMTKTLLRGGTAHKGFRRLERDPVLGKLDIGGKTGSLTGQNPPGKNLWFVGYARGPKRSIAVAIVLVHGRIWRVKPAQLSREIMNSYFSPKPVLEARVKGSRNG